MKLLNLLFIYRKEKERQRDRDEAWSRVEELAMRNPGYCPSRISNMENNMDIDMGSPMGEGDMEEEITYEKLEMEAREVPLYVLIVYKISTM